MSIIAFYSEASGTGKDTASNYAAEFLRSRGEPVRRDAFAWDGKVVCADALGIKGTRIEKIKAIDRLKLCAKVKHWYPGRSGPGYNGYEVNGREFIIGLLGDPESGTGIRGLDEGFWTRQVMLRALIPPTSWIVISDLRFLEEAQAVVRNGGRVVEIVRQSNLGTFNEHRLSPELIDHTIWNIDSLDDLRDNVESYVDGLIRGVVA